MKINTSHLVGAAIVLTAVFFSKLDAQDAPAKAEPQKWEYAEIMRSMSKRERVTIRQRLNTPDGRFPKSIINPTLPYGLEWKLEGFRDDLPEALNLMGADGWELCYEHESETDWMTYLRVVFKRPKQ